MKEKATSSYAKIIFYLLLLSFIGHFLTLLIKLSPPPTHEDKSIAKKKEKRIRLVVKKNPKKQQIVSTEKKREKKPDEPAFLGEYNQSFDRQTTATKIAPFKKAGQGEKNARPTLFAQPNPSPPQKKQSSSKKKILGKRLKFQDLNIGSTMTEAIQRSPAAAQKGQKNGDRKESGLAQNNDFLEDVPMGDVTNLNTVEYKYYSFFNRIKRKLEVHWGKSLREKTLAMYKDGRRIPANSLQITSLIISLDSKGNIVNIVIKGSSGIREFDDAALESFNRAGPFPNPPKSMLKNGTARIEWGFVVKG